jgi:hypothetical protein
MYCASVFKVCGFCSVSVYITNNGHECNIATAIFFILFIKKVFYGCNGVVYQHSWTSPAHHIPNLLAHVGAITMDGTALARGFLVAKCATIEPLVRVCLELLILLWHLATLQLVLAI